MVVSVATRMHILALGRLTVPFERWILIAEELLCVGIARSGKAELSPYSEKGSVSLCIHTHFLETAFFFKRHEWFLCLPADGAQPSRGNQGCGFLCLLPIPPPPFSPIFFSGRGLSFQVPGRKSHKTICQSADSLKIELNDVCLE